MQNSHPRRESPGAGASLALGPRSAAPGPVLATTAQGEVFEHLRQLTQPVSVTTLAVDLGLHPNTVREHVTALVDLGVVERVRLVTTGRGRPAYGYVVVRSADAGASAALLEALVTHLAETAPTPEAKAAELGRRYAVHTPGAAARSGRKPGEAVADGMRQLGYSAEPDRSGLVVRLRDCPLLDAARSHPDVVCGFHRGLAQGLAGTAGLDPGAIRLVPFAEPGACRLELPPPTQ